MRIVTWNLNRRMLNGASWRYLLGTLAPDIALVQECTPPEWVKSEYGVVFVPARDGARSGSAIVVRGEITPLLQDATFGPVVVGKVSIEDRGLTVANVHARIPQKRLAPDVPAGRVVPPLRRIFASIRPLLTPPFVIGGDLNSFRSAEQKWPRNGHGAFWAELDTWLFDCHWRLNKREHATYRGRGAPLQDDHIFVDPPTGEDHRVEACWVVEDQEVLPMSDHVPLVAEIAL